MGQTTTYSPKLLQHPPIDPVGGPVHLRSHDSLAVGRWASSGRLDVAEVTGGAVELRTEGLMYGGPSPILHDRLSRRLFGPRNKTAIDRDYAVPLHSNSSKPTHPDGSLLVRPNSRKPTHPDGSPPARPGKSWTRPTCACLLVQLSRYARFLRGVNPGGAVEPRGRGATLRLGGSVTARLVRCDSLGSFARARREVSHGNFHAEHSQFPQAGRSCFPT